MIEIVTSLLIVIGLFFILVGSLGLLRFPDVYNRLHATTKSATLGVVSVLLASVAFFSSQSPAVTVKQLAAIAFLYLSSPVGAHMISRAAHLTGVPLAHGSVRDDLEARRGSSQHKE